MKDPYVSDQQRMINFSRPPPPTHTHTHPFARYYSRNACQFSRVSTKIVTSSEKPAWPKMLLLREICRLSPYICQLHLYVIICFCHSLLCKIIDFLHSIYGSFPANLACLLLNFEGMCPRTDRASVPLLSVMSFFIHKSETTAG